MTTRKKTLLITLMMAIMVFSSGVISAAAHSFVFIAYMLGTLVTVACPTKKKD